MHRKTLATFAALVSVGGITLIHTFAVAQTPPLSPPVATASATPAASAASTPTQDAENAIALKHAADNFPEYPQRPPSQLIHYIGDALNKFPLIGLLCILIGVDVVMGTLAAFGTKKLSSNVSWRGMCKKAASMLIVGTAAAIEPLMGFPLAKFVALFYVWTETISIVEAAAALGVPLPPQLLSALVKLRDNDGQARADAIDQNTAAILGNTAAASAASDPANP